MGATTGRGRALQRGAALVAMVQVLVVLGALGLTPTSPAAAATTAVDDIVSVTSIDGRPSSMVTGPDGNVWVTDQTADAIVRVEPGGTTTVFTDPGIVEPAGIVVGPDSNLWFTNGRTGSIGRITPAGVVATFPVAGSVWHRSLTAGPDGNLWFVDPGAQLIRRITTTGTITSWSGDALLGPYGIVTGFDGNLWITNRVGNTIVRITPAGTYVDMLHDHNVMSSPESIVRGPDGNLWFVNATGSIGKVSASGSFSKVGVGATSLAGSTVAFGGDVALWYTRPEEGTVGRLPLDGAHETFGDDLLEEAAAVAPGPDGDIWFGTESGTIGRLVLTRTAPAAPTAVTATTAYRSATVTWTPPLFTGNSPITSYTVHASQSGGSCTSTGTSCTITGLLPGHTYTFTVRASNAHGDGPWSWSSPGATVFRGATFHPVTPARLLDSRGTTGGWNTRLTHAIPRWLVVAGVGGVPTNATAVVLNVTAVESTEASFLTVYPRGATKPNASNLNVEAGQIVPNLVTVKVGDVRSVSIATAAGTTHVVVDVVGYYDDGHGGGAMLEPIAPRRLLDSRGSTGGWSGKLEAGTTRDLPVRASVNPQLGVPDDATAVVANVTVTQPDASSFLKVWPSGVEQPNVSNLNFVAGQTTPNLVTVGIGTDGAIRFANAVGSVHVVVDVVGYYRPGAGSRFYPILPTRVLDTREGNGLSGLFQPQQVRTLAVGGRVGTNVPAAATGVVANVTVTDASAQSLLTVYPGDVPKPNASNLNFLPWQTVPNLVAVGLAPDGTVKIYNDQGTVNVVADVTGFFAP